MKKEHRGTIKEFVEKYRELFYDNRKYKKVPDIILNAPYSIREAFFIGYYAGDGSKKDTSLTITNKGEIYSCGGGSFGQLGLGHINKMPLDTDRYPFMPIPTKIDSLSDVKITSISCGDSHSMAIDEKGKLCSYFNFSGAERKNIDLACLFAFMDIRRVQGDVAFNFSMYDELFDSSLDERGVAVRMM